MHTCQVELSRGNLGSGLQIFLESQRYPWWTNAFPGELVAERTTILRHQGQTLRGMEHLSAALAAWPSADICVRISGGDVPILDGSAQPWHLALTELLGPAPGFALRDCPLNWEHAWPSGYIRVRPHAQLKVTLSLGMWHQGTPEIIELHPGDSPAELFLARTFITSAEWNQALAQGLLSGAQAESGILLSPAADHWRVAIGGDFRHPQEPLWHKCADLLGDLTFLGRQLPKLHVEIHNGGHAIHHQLIQRIRNVIT